MKISFDTAQAVKILRDGIKKGYWTLEDLDVAPPGTQSNLNDFRRHPMAKNYTGEFPEYRNLLRDQGDSKDNPQDDFIL